MCRTTADQYEGARRPMLSRDEIDFINEVAAGREWEYCRESDQRGAFSLKIGDKVRTFLLGLGRFPSVRVRETGGEYTGASQVSTIQWAILSEFTERED